MKNSNVRYIVKIAETNEEIESALRLRFDVFRVELGKHKIAENAVKLDFDGYDARCRHLIVVESATGKTIGTYRLNMPSKHEKVDQFYSFGEFAIEKLPERVLAQSVEVGRACIAGEHRNSRVLFLLWKGLADFLKKNNRRYFFGCCSIFTVDRAIGRRVYNQLKDRGFLHQEFRIDPRNKDELMVENYFENPEPVKLPMLFEMYLKIGSKVCGPPVVDPQFGTIDFFVIVDRFALNEKYRRMFFGETYQTNTFSSKSNFNSSSKVKTVELQVP